MRSRGRVLVVLLVLVLVLAAGGAAGYFFYFKGRPAKGAESPEVSYHLALTDMVINLADRDRPRYLTASVTLVLLGAEPEKSAEEGEAEIRDAVLMVMSKHSYRDLLSAEGKETLKSDLKGAVGEVTEEAGVSVEQVLFTSFVMD